MVRVPNEETFLFWHRVILLVDNMPHRQSLKYFWGEVCFYCIIIDFLSTKNFYKRLVRIFHLKTHFGKESPSNSLYHCITERDFDLLIE